MSKAVPWSGLVRTSGSPEDRHAGLSQMIVDLSLPGITVRTIGDLTGDHAELEPKVVFDSQVVLHERCKARER